LAAVLAVTQAIAPEAARTVDSFPPQLAWARETCAR
jgi:hypothetical protein